MNRYCIAPRAQQDLQSIWQYIAVAKSSPGGARALLDRLYRAFTLLAENPLLGELREDLRPGLRVFSADSYVVLYYALRDGIEVAGVIHGARDIAGLFRRGERCSPPPTTGGLAIGRWMVSDSGQAARGKAASGGRCPGPVFHPSIRRRSHAMPLTRFRRGLTLVELIVALAIIGILIALLLPAIQAAREAARRAQCSNNLRQLALASLNYEAVYRCFPASSIQKDLTARAPAPGSGNKDGKGAGFSWMVSILPFIEQQPLYDKVDFKRWPYDGSDDHKLVAGTEVRVYLCPSYAGPKFSHAPDYPKDSQALSNYAGLGATHAASLYRTEKEPVGGKRHPNGILYPGSWTRLGDVRDGASNTLLFCETREDRYAAWFDGTTAAVVALAQESRPKFEQPDEDGPYVPAEGVLSALNYGDPKSMPVRAYLPKADHSGAEDRLFGPSSQHPGIVQHAFCDGSARAIAETLDPAVYMFLTTRAGRENVDAEF